MGVKGASGPPCGVALCALLVALTACSTAGAAERRVLLVTEARGFVHDSIPTAAAFFQRLGRRSPNYDVEALSGVSELTAGRLRRANAVVFAQTTGELPLPSRQALVRFVRNGGAFIGTHSASDTLHSWPGYARLLGAEFLRHGAIQEGRLTVTGRRHAITRGLPRSFDLTEEFYEFVDPAAGPKRVLVRLDPDSVEDEVKASLPLVWIRRHGKGRVLYNALGHLPQTWAVPIFRRLMTRGMRWALGS